ncbi:MAG: MATE family efflux transporter [Ignavibacteriaceae bacterium]|nr:MATE family efflux transporter [Ignavibacteriaceae bacterium]
MQNKISSFFIPDSNYSKKILALALPVIAGLSTQMLLSLVDTAMVGRLENSEYTLAAMALGLLATWAIVAFCSSLSTGTHVLVARNFGEKNFVACKDILYNSFILGILIGMVIAAAGWYLSESIAFFVAKDDRVAELTTQYMKYRFLGLPFFLITVAYRGFFFGIGQTKIFMISAIITNLLNILFNYMFIFGEFGAPKMGVAGASIGTSLATVADAAFYTIISFSFKSIRVKFNIFHRLRIMKDTIKAILKLSFPVSLQNVFTLLGFLSFVAVTGLLDTTSQGASQTIISTLFISYLPCNGFGIAVQTLVGNYATSKDSYLVQKYTFETAKIATIFTLLLSIIFIFFPEYLLMITTNNQSIIETAIPGLRVAGVAQIFFGGGMVFAYALQALGKTFYVMLVEMITNLLVFVPLSYLLGIVIFQNLSGAWSALIIYTILYIILMFIKFRKESKVTVN